MAGVCEAERVFTSADVSASRVAVGPIRLDGRTGRCHSAGRSGRGGTGGVLAALLPISSAVSLLFYD